MDKSLLLTKALTDLRAAYAARKDADAAIEAALARAVQAEFPQAEVESYYGVVRVKYGPAREEYVIFELLPGTGAPFSTPLYRVSIPSYSGSDEWATQSSSRSYRAAFDQFLVRGLQGRASDCADRARMILEILSPAHDTSST